MKEKLLNYGQYDMILSRGELASAYSISMPKSNILPQKVHYK